MARHKTKAIRKGKEVVGESSAAAMDVETERVERAKRARADAEARKSKEKKLWVQKLSSRNFKCERQVDRSTLEGNPIMQTLAAQGLIFFCAKVDGYRPGIVTSFYENMELQNDLVIDSFVGGITVTITPDVIARYLHYTRPLPGTITYPSPHWNKDLDHIIATLTDDEHGFNPHFNRYTAGALRELYRLSNKIVSYNLSPYCREKTPMKTDGDVLFAFGSGEEIVDWASFVWEQMRVFRLKGAAAGNIPFPAMITKLCMLAGCKHKSTDKLVPGTPGPITLSSVKKSRSLSHPVDVEELAESRPTARGQFDRIEQWCEIIVARQDDLYDKQGNVRKRQIKIEKKLDEQAKIQNKILRGLRWVIGRQEEASGVVYEEEVEEAEEEENGEEVVPADVPEGEQADVPEEEHDGGI